MISEKIRKVYIDIKKVSPPPENPSTSKNNIYIFKKLPDLKKRECSDLYKNTTDIKESVILIFSKKWPRQKATLIMEKPPISSKSPLTKTD